MSISYAPHQAPARAPEPAQLKAYRERGYCIVDDLYAGDKLRDIEAFFEGSHRSDIFCPEGEAAGWMEYGDSHVRPFPRAFKPVPVPVKRGQTLFFGGQLIHGSGPNRHPSRSRRTFIGHYIDAASEEVSRFYHPVINREGRVVSSIGTATGGGPCGDGAGGGLH